MLASMSVPGMRDDQDLELQVTECLLPGLSRATADALGRRVRLELTRPAGCRVSFVGALLMPAEEALLRLFAGGHAAVRAGSELAGLPFERILACLGIGWQETR